MISEKQIYRKGRFHQRLRLRQGCVVACRRFAYVLGRQRLIVPPDMFVTDDKGLARAVAAPLMSVARVSNVLSVCGRVSNSDLHL